MSTAAAFPHYTPPPPAGGSMFPDDEPLDLQVPRAPKAEATNNGGGGALVLSTQCEFPALGRSASRDKFSVLVHARAPADVARAPLDLVTVLDVSGSMEGKKLELLKQAMCFVIDQLGRAERLSVVTFTGYAVRWIRLSRMTDAGKASAKLAVLSLVPEWAGTNIGEGLRVGAEDTFLGTYLPNGAKRYMDLVPPAFANSASRPGPIHTFGFGAKHDAAALHTIAEATGGTFSFVESHAAIQDSFAQCIGGLLSVAVQQARIAVTCLHRGVRVQEVKSGSYGNSVGADGRAASIDVGELYDDEERRFMVLLYVPRARSTEEVTRLLKVSCTYRDAATGNEAHVAAPAAVIQRPLELTYMPPPSMEVERERVRLAATEGIAAARAAADGGQHSGAAWILESKLKAVEQSAPGAAGDPALEALKEELRDLSLSVGDRRKYEQTGRARLLAGMSSHAQQRASAMGMDVQSTSKARALRRWRKWWRCRVRAGRSVAMATTSRQTAHRGWLSRSR
ncbi:unnamed protein product [Miscanthus lutarioriparius]|uniref:VWFA domain-containing protein n=1 Tax=Miscanthus lutarioriparius TaxID=422564 RepID=A0A811Q630_9POAL|nr:unnamed protein product [Miscanthus lutarioriparius]